MLNFISLVKNSFKETLREPFFLMLLLFSVVITGLFPTLSLFVFREQQKLVIDSAMATTMVFGLITAVLSANYTIHKEMRNGTILLLLSKPVYRWSYVLAKIVGLVMALSVFVLTCNASTLIALKIAKDQFRLDYTLVYTYYTVIVVALFIAGGINFLFRKSFIAYASTLLCLLLSLFIAILYVLPVKEGAIPVNTEVIPTLILLFFLVWTMGTVSILVSIKFDIVPNLIICSVIFFLGLTSNYFFKVTPDTSFVLALFLKAGAAIVPNWQYFWTADVLSSNKTLPIEYIGYTAVYMFLYNVLCIVWAITLFKNKEIASYSQ